MTRSSNDPYQNLNLLRDQISRLFESTMARTTGPEWEESPQWSPLVDMFETDEQVVLVAEVPGLSMDELDVQVTDSSVTLKGTRPSYAGEGEVVPQRLERAHGSFSRTFQFNSTIDRDRVTAEYKLGLLQVVLPKRRRSRPKSIQVNKN